MVDSREFWFAAQSAQWRPHNNKICNTILGSDQDKVRQTSNGGEGGGEVVSGEVVGGVAKAEGERQHALPYILYWSNVW